MKRTGVIRRFDDLGRITIPKGIRRQLGIQKETLMEIYINEDKSITLKFYTPKEKNLKKELPR